MEKIPMVEIPQDRYEELMDYEAKYHDAREKMAYCLDIPLQDFGGTSRVRQLKGKKDPSLYVGIGPEHGRQVPENVAYQYALDRCLNGSECDQQEFREMLVEWFYSGNWIRRDESA